MKKIRKIKKSDQESAKKVFNLIINLMRECKEVESDLWVGALWAIMVNGYKDSGFSYEDFCHELETVSENFKWWWDDDN